MTRWVVVGLLCGWVVAGCASRNPIAWVNESNRPGDTAPFLRDAYGCERDAAYLPQSIPNQLPYAQPQNPAQALGNLGAVFGNLAAAQADAEYARGLVARCME